MTTNNTSDRNIKQRFLKTVFRYAGEYVPDGRQFIVVAGNINYETVQVRSLFEIFII